jgi:hypothetical protein
MSNPNQHMPYTAAFPKALGTGIVIQSELPIDTQLMGKLNAFIEHYEAVLSRFRNDSLVTAMSHAVHGGAFEFPQWALPLFELYDRLVALSDGAIDPCIGEDLIRLGYGADMRFTVEPDAAQHLGSLHGRPTWQGDVERHGTTLITHKAVSLDFGACGKGYLVDLLTALIDGYYGDDFNVAHCTDSTDNADTANVVDKAGINKLSHCDPNDRDSSDRKSMPPDDSSSWPKPVSTTNPLLRITLTAMSHTDPTPHTNPASPGSSANETSYYTADDNDAPLCDIFAFGRPISAVKPVTSNPVPTRYRCGRRLIYSIGRSHRHRTRKSLEYRRGRGKRANRKRLVLRLRPQPPELGNNASASSSAQRHRWPPRQRRGGIMGKRQPRKSAR